jgi:hypothetical protein
MVKEGDSQCEICLMSDGTISIEGGTIYLGENSAGNTTQPVVKGADLAAAVTAFCTAISTSLGTGAECGNLAQELTTAAAITTACTVFDAAVTAALSGMVYTK